MPRAPTYPPIQIEGVSITRVRGPRADGRIYWRARRGDSVLWTGWGTREEASAIGARLTLGETPSTGDLLTVEDLVHDWFCDQEERAASGQLASRTLKTYRTAARALIKALGPVYLRAITTSTLDRFRDTRLKSGMATRTVQLELRILRQAWAWAYERGKVSTERLPRCAVRIQDRRSRYTPSRDEIAKVLDHLSGWAWLLVRLLWATGCRLGEIASLRRRDADAGQALLHVRGKTGAREVAVVPSVLVELLPHMATGPDDYVIGVGPNHSQKTIAGILRETCQSAGVPHFSPQALRRWATDALYDTGADPSLEAAHVGHAPEVALGHYRTARLDARRAAVERAGLGVLPSDGGEVVLLGVASREALERAVVEAAVRGDLAEVARLAERIRGLDGTTTAQIRR